MDTPKNRMLGNALARADANFIANAQKMEKLVFTMLMVVVA